MKKEEQEVKVEKGETETGEGQLRNMIKERRVETIIMINTRETEEGRGLP